MLGEKAGEAAAAAAAREHIAQRPHTTQQGRRSHRCRNQQWRDTSTVSYEGRCGRWWSACLCCTLQERWQRALRCPAHGCHWCDYQRAFRTRYAQDYCITASELTMQWALIFLLLDSLLQHTGNHFHFCSPVLEISGPSLLPNLHSTFVLLLADQVCTAHLDSCLWIHLT